MSRTALAIVLVVLFASHLRAADPKQAADKAAAAREAAQRALDEAQAAARVAKAAAQAAAEDARRSAAAAAAAAKEAVRDDKTLLLFDGKSLEGWTETNFAGAGEIKVEKGQIVMQLGDSLTGITWKDAARLPTDNYEISLLAMKLKGDDFFCGLTFPVRDSHASLILGGWGGTLVGLSSIDGLDASENETTIYRKFDANKWYKVRLRVAENKIQAWVDDEQVIDVDMTDKRFSTRIEVDASRPLGIATYQVSAAFKDVTLKRLK
jgi:multidrug efflux pump subunit AcrA (membrane-fusion protein)